MEVLPNTLAAEVVSDLARLMRNAKKPFPYPLVERLDGRRARLVWLKASALQLLP